MKIFFEDHVKSAISRLLKKSIVGKDVVFANRNRYLISSMDRYVNTEDVLYCYVDNVPDNPELKEITDVLDEYIEKHSNVVVIQYPGIEFAVIRLLLDLGFSGYEKYKVVFDYVWGYINYDIIEIYKDYSFERYCKTVLNADSDVSLHNLVLEDWELEDGKISKEGQGLFYVREEYPDALSEYKFYSLEMRANMLLVYLPQSWRYFGGTEERHGYDMYEVVDWWGRIINLRSITSIDEPMRVFTSREFMNRNARIVENVIKFYDRLQLAEDLDNDTKVINSVKICPDVCFSTKRMSLGALQEVLKLCKGYILLEGDFRSIKLNEINVIVNDHYHVTCVDDFMYIIEYVCKRT